MVDHLPQLVCVSCADTGEAIYVNRVFRDYFGNIGPARAARLACVHPDDLFKANSLRIDKLDVTKEIECRLKRRDGAHLWHKLVYQPLWMSGRRVLLGTALDIHDIVVARRRIEESTALLRLAQDAAAAAVWDWDPQSDTLRVSVQNSRLYGAEAPYGDSDEMIIVDHDEIISRLHPDDVERVRDSGRAALETRSDFSVEFRSKDPVDASRWRWLQSYGRLVMDDSTGQPVRAVGLTMDVTARRAVEEALRISEERLALALDSGDDGLFDWDLAADEMRMSERWIRALGCELGWTDAGWTFFERHVHPDDRIAVTEAIREHLDGRSTAIECEHRLIRTDGSGLWVLTRGRIVERDDEGRAKRIVGTQIDISRRKSAELRVQHMVLHDALTGLPNRALFRDRLEQASAQTPRGGGFAVLACDLDRFKAVNDTLGYAAGDSLLRIVAQRLTSVVRCYDTVARLGGDEFGIVLVNLDCKDTAMRLAERLVASVSAPVRLDDMTVEVGLSIGITFLAGERIDCDEAYKRADIALHEAKAKGRNLVAEFKTEAGGRVSMRGVLGLDMKESLRRGDFSLRYQPVIDIASAMVTSFEALLRWRHPTRGDIPPSDFIPIAEDNGLIIALGCFALNEACKEAADWSGDVRVAVNVSALQLTRGGFEATVSAALAAADLPPGRLKLEVTESVLMQDTDGVLEQLRSLQKMGVRIALDDFGTGFSSLSYLRRFPFDKIKIDRGFIREIADPDAAAIIRAVVSIGERLGMGIVAEGVETEEQLDLVRKEGCTEVQGYLYGRPMTAAAARSFLASHNTVAE